MEEHRESQPHQVSSEAYPLCVCPEDEISLLDLWRVLVRQWKVIGAITGLTVLGAVAYVLLASPVYEAQAVMRQPESKYIEALNIPGVSKVSSGDIFAKFIGNLKTGALKSSSLRQQFFAENPQFSSLQDNLPKIKAGMKNEEGFIILSLQGYDSKLLADWVNGFIVLAERRSIDDFLNGVETNIANRRNEIESQLRIGRDFEGQRRRDRIALLEEQIAIARASKIFDRKPSNYTTMANQSGGVTLNTAQEPLYMRGVKELSAEKAELERRKNDEPFIAGFRDKQEGLARLDAGLKQLQAARALVHAVTIDQPAIQSKIPVKPRRMFVLALTVVLGGIIGVFVAFVVNLVQQQKR